jgi:hypothetical protein
MSDRFIVSMNFISKGLKTGCRKNIVCISYARPDGLDQKLVLMRQQETCCALNTKITISSAILLSNE